VSVYWVTDVGRDLVHVHTGPTPDGYTTVEQRTADEPLDACGVALTLREFREPPRP
jgi:hypothetical protein